MRSIRLKPCLPSRYVLGALACWMLHATAGAQRPSDDTMPAFTRGDTLRGMLREERTCYDVRWYHLDVRIDPAGQSLSGRTTIRFTAQSPSQRIQVDLFKEMSIESITLDRGQALPFTREFNAVFVSLPQPLTPGNTYDLVISYAGKPHVATNPPWDGGFIWTTSDSTTPWVAVACQGTGASLWWPNKDHQSDEPDSMLISVTVPPGLEDVSNGRLRSVTRLPDGWSRYDWVVSAPINNYDVTVNIGRFAHFAETRIDTDTLTLDYYVVPSHLEKAKKQFAQVKPMIACFERDFGEYPFVHDGYKLVESPHLGMEHQSAVAYGNGFVQGYRGTSPSRWGVKFDFIIVHESAHEWWGNSVTAKDIADMWIHEGFAAYAEGLYVECMFGHEAMLEYLNAKKSQVGNRRPIIGAYNVNKEGSGDMYPKGALMLHTLRNVIDNDSLWFALMRGIQREFRYQTITTEDLVSYVTRTTGTDYTYLFDQYLRYSSLPRLDVMLVSKADTLTVRYRWRADVKDFRMPVKVTRAPGSYAFIYPTAEWQTLGLTGMDAHQFRIADELFYLDPQIRIMYQDPESPGRIARRR